MVIDGPGGRQTNTVRIDFLDGTIGRDGVAHGKAICHQHGAERVATWEARRVNRGYQLCLLPPTQGRAGQNQYLDLAGLARSPNGAQLQPFLAPFQPSDLVPKWDIADNSLRRNEPGPEGFGLLNQLP